MFEESFEKLDEKEISKILEELNPMFNGSEFKANETTIMAAKLSFYPGFKFLDIINHKVVPSLKRYVLYKKKASVVIDFTNRPIYRLNQILPIKLNKKNIDEYIRFFFTYVRGKKGRFIVVENIDDIHWKEDPPPSARRAISSIIKPISLIKGSSKDNYSLEVCMVFKDSLFQTIVDVSKDGQVHLGQEELLIEEMPVLDDTFGQ